LRPAHSCALDDGGGRQAAVRVVDRIMPLRIPDRPPLRAVQAASGAAVLSHGTAALFRARSLQFAEPDVRLMRPETRCPISA
jgi:hypothetical protein